MWVTNLEIGALVRNKETGKLGRVISREYSGTELHPLRFGAAEENSGVLAMVFSGTTAA